MPNPQQDSTRIPPHQGGCWFCQTVDNWDDMRFDSEFDTNVHISCIKADIDKGVPSEAPIMAYLLDDTNVNSMSHPPFSPRTILPIKSITKIVRIDGELHVKPLDWSEGDYD